METLAENYGVNIHWRSFELRPRSAPPISEAYKAYILARRPLFEQTAREYYGLEVFAGPFGINSRPALIGAKVAEAWGVGEAYHKRVMSAYWQEGQNLEDESVLRQIADDAGLNPDDFMAALDDPQYEDAVNADIVIAYQMGINGVPALLFNRKYFISGAQPYELFAQVIQRIESGELA